MLPISVSTSSPSRVAGARALEHAPEDLEEVVAVAGADRSRPEQLPGVAVLLGLEVQAHHRAREHVLVAAAERRPHRLRLLLRRRTARRGRLARHEEQSRAHAQLLVDEAREAQERLLPRVLLVGGDRARLRLGLLGRAAHLLILEIDRAAGALQLLALQEEADHEPQERERREGAFEEAAHRRRSLLDESIEADDAEDVVELREHPRDGEPEPEAQQPRRVARRVVGVERLHQPITASWRDCASSCPSRLHTSPSSSTKPCSAKRERNTAR